MATDPVLAALVGRWEEAHRNGHSLSVAELCRGTPELVGPLQQALAEMVVHAAASRERPPTVPGYDLGEEIGRGGMGVVYRARDLGIGRDVAVKLLQERYAADSEAASRFVEEARITGQLQHPGIPAVYQVGALPNGRPYLVMKLIKGDTLEALLTAWPVNTLAVFEGICQAVGYAHAHRVIHRDLKPQNVMVGSFGEVQVMDWGLAKVLLPSLRGGKRAGSEVDQHAPDPTEICAARGVDTPNTQHGSVFGTPAYMAPEQAGGETDKIDTRSDVFGLGAILCRMLTGHPPFAGQYTEVRLNAVRGNTAAALARLDECGAEPGLVALCKGCLSFDPAARPADANAVAAAVAALRTEAEGRARRAELDRLKAEVQAAEQRKRRRVVQWAGGVTAAVLLAGVVGTTIGLVRAERHRADAVTARNDLWDMLDAMTTAITGDLQDKQKEITPGQKDILANLLPVYQKLAEKTWDDEKTRSRMASAAFRLGMIEYRLGRQELVATALHVARNEYERLAADFPANPAYRWELARTHHNLGLLLAEPDQRAEAEAEAEYRQGLALLEKLVADFPANPNYRRELAHNYNNLGLLLVELKQWAEAEGQYRRGLALLEQLAADSPDVTDHRVELGVVYINFSAFLYNRSRPDDSRAWCQKAIDALRPIYERGPPAVKAKEALRNGYWRRAIAHDRMQKFAEAAADWDRATELSKVEERPQFRVCRATSLLNAGHGAEAVAEIAGLSKPPHGNARQWYDLACLYAVASGKIEDKKREYADRAMESLEQAVEAGYKNAGHVKTDTDLAPLRGRDDFKKLLADLEAKFPTK
jgi:tetratricopeptide (TPR) repeat protein